MIMSTTEQIAFGEVAEFKNGLNFSASDYGRGTKIIGVADFKDYTTPRYEELSEVSLDVASKKDMYLKNGDIVFVRSMVTRLWLAVQWRSRICRRRSVFQVLLFGHGRTEA